MKKYEKRLDFLKNIQDITIEYNTNYIGW